MLAVGMYCHSSLFPFLAICVLFHLPCNGGCLGVRLSETLRQLRPDQDLGELSAVIPALGCSLQLPFFQIRFEVLDQPPAVGT